MRPYREAAAPSKFKLTLRGGPAGVGQCADDQVRWWGLSFAVIKTKQFPFNAPGIAPAVDQRLSQQKRQACRPSHADGLAKHLRTTARIDAAKQVYPMVVPRPTPFKKENNLIENLSDYQCLVCQRTSLFAARLYLMQ